uniref:ATP synthase F0 subunit 8 n=1 Tax=Melibe leonina TaxID=76178 RepID=A0A0F6QHK0_MELLB|nr:ATP synthase F0 subunit 8 [Melibe leonina]AKE07277.1 ATP synthase F0 subunit 8 [Melibe leonina]
MPQLSPMMGFIMFLVVLSMAYLFSSGVSKTSCRTTPSKAVKSSRGPFSLFYMKWQKNA